MNLETRKPWMQNLSEYLRDIPINEIILPGTHDSGAYQIDFSKPIGNKKIKFANKIIKYLPCVANIIKEWTLAQSKSIYDQLKDGIRLCDFRISYNEDLNDYYITHTFTCVKLDVVLNDIAKFLNEDLEEIVVLLFKPDHPHRKSMTKERNNEVIEKIKMILSQHICYRTHDDTFKTYGEMVDTSQRVIIYYKSNKDNYDYVWPSSNVYNPWDNTSNVIEKLDMLSVDFEKMIKSVKIMNFIELTLTPQKKDIIDDIKKRILLPSNCCYDPNSLYKMSKNIQKYYNTIIRDNSYKIYYLSGIYTDFPDKEFINNVILLNHQ